MRNKFLGIEYNRGCGRIAKGGFAALAPRAVQKVLPDADWIFVPATAQCKDRMLDAARISKEIYNTTPRGRHIMIGGDHSVNFGHFSALAGQFADDLCLIYIDAHTDVHTPESSESGAPHGMNVRALLGQGDSRWLEICGRAALKPENLFYLGIRSWESAEEKFVQESNIFIRRAADLKTLKSRAAAVEKIRKQIGGRPFVVSFDFDSLDPGIFPEVQVPEPDGISLDCAEFFLRHFRKAVGFEFVEWAPAGNPRCAEIAKGLISIVMN